MTIIETKSESEHELLAPNGLTIDTLSAVVLDGDLAKLKPAQRIEYYGAICAHCGLDPATRPFEYIKLNGRLVLYARKEATDQLRTIRGVSVTAMQAEVIMDAIYRVTVTVKDAKGRTDMGTGAVAVKGLGGDSLANAMMKCETKAKRRATLSICGLGMLDETELDTAQAETSVTIAPADMTVLEGESHDPRAEGRKAVMEAVQFLSGRDFGGQEIGEEEAGRLFLQAQALMPEGGKCKHDHKEVAAWMKEHGVLIPVADDRGEVTGLRLGKAAE